MSRPAATLALLLGATVAARPTDAADPPTVSDFVGTWRIAAIMGASDGGVTGTATIWWMLLGVGGFIGWTENRAKQAVLF